MQALSVTNDSFVRLMDEAECYEQLRRLRWPDGQVRCPYCGGHHIRRRWRYHRSPYSWRYECADCQVTFNDKTGTIFEHTKLPLRAWFLGFYLAQLGQSTAAIARELPCDYHTAHRIVWLVRKAVVRIEEGRVLQGTVEADEIYVTAGHKGQAEGGGCKQLAFSPSATRQTPRSRAGERRERCAWHPGHVRQRVRAAHPEGHPRCSSFHPRADHDASH